MKTKHQVRKNFRQSVFSRDKFRCRKCNKTGVLDAHHITDRHNMPNGGYVKENGISLCGFCHLNAGHGIYTPDELYGLIGSSYEIAYQKSL